MRTFVHRPKAIQQTKTAKCTKPSRPLSGQSHDVQSILHLQHAIGNQAVQQLLRSNAEEFQAGSATAASTRFGHDFSRIPLFSPSPVHVQPKVTVNAPGDMYEQEADDVANQVMRMPEPQLQHGCPCGGECPKCQMKHPGQDHESLQTKHVQAIDTGRIAISPVVDEVLSSVGQPVDTATRNITESRFGHDFSRVRMHTDVKAAGSAQAMNALRLDTLAPSLLPLADGLSLAEGERLVKIQITPRESPRLVSPDASKAIRAACDKRCGLLVGGASFGETECDIDERGNPTGTVRVTVTDTDPCTRPCVEKHEAIHAVLLAPVCGQLHACITTAGQDYDAQDKCYEIFQTQLFTMAPGMECAAYKLEAECMHGRQSQPECASKEAKARLASRLRGVECYRDCFCTGVATGSAPKRRGQLR